MSKLLKTFVFSQTPGFTVHTLLQYFVLYISTLFSDISNFEVEKELWRPYLSLCLQNLSPLSTSLSI